MLSKSLREWSKKASKQTESYRSIYSLVYGIDRLSYFVYRTKLQFANLCAKIVLHFFEYVLIIHTMPTFVLTAMLLRVTIVAVESGWWGVMESMRDRIRSHNERNDKQAIQKEIEDWLSIAKKLALLAVIIGFVCIAFIAPNKSESAVILLLSLYLAARIILRTLYSGVYALRRVYVRFDWIVIAEVSVFLVAWILKPYLGEWTLPVCIALNIVTSSWISYYFIKNSLDFMRLEPRALLMPPSIKSVLQNYTSGQLWLPGVAMIIIKLHDILLILLLQLYVSKNIEHQSILIAFYVAMPAVRTAMSWSQILYFDLVRNQLDVFSNFRRYFEWLGLGYALVYGLLIAFVAAIAVYLCVDESLIGIELIIGYILISSVFGLIQISLFSRERYIVIIAITLLHYFLLTYFIISEFNIVGVALTLLLPSIIGMILLQLIRGRQERADYNFLQWVKLVLQAKEKPMSLIVAKLVHNIPKSVRRHILDKLTEIFKKDSLLSYYKDHILIVSDLIEKKNDLRDDILHAGMGYVVSIQTYDSFDGVKIFDYLYEKRIVPNVEPKLSRKQIVDHFLENFPNGLVQFPTQRNQKLINELSRDELYEVTRNVLTYAQGNPNYSDSNWFITSMQNKGFIDVIFLIRKNETSPDQRNYWLKYLAGSL